VQALAALIASQGLLHPLILFKRASASGKTRKLRFEVAAGERRRRTMLLLQREGRLSKGHEAIPLV
jgi:ParB family chromosome partitioning protein